MYRLVNRQLGRGAYRLVTMRKEGTVVPAEIGKISGVGFYGINSHLMRALPRYFVDFFVTKKSMTLVDGMLVEALRENGNFIEMFLLWFGVSELTAMSLCVDILACKNVSRITLDNDAKDNTVMVYWDYEENGEATTRSAQCLHKTFSLDLGDFNETVFNFALDNPFVIFAAILKAAKQKTVSRVKVCLPITFRTRFIEETFYRMFFWMMNAAARLTQEMYDVALPENLGTFDERYLDYRVSHALSFLAAKSAGRDIEMCFTDDGAYFNVGPYLTLYEVVGGSYKVTLKATDRLIDAVESRSFDPGISGFSIIRNKDEAMAFDISINELQGTFEASANVAELGSTKLGFPLIIVTDSKIYRKDDTRLWGYGIVFYDFRTGTGFGSIEAETRFPRPDADGVVKLDISASQWLSDQANKATLLAFEGILRIIKRHDKKCVIERSDGLPFTIHEGFLDMLSRGLTKGKPTEQTNFQLKHTVRHELLGAQLKSITIDMTHVQPLETMVIVRA